MKKGTKFQHKRPDEPQVCAICGFPLKTYNALGKHVAKYHSSQCTMKEYVDKYIEPFAHKCPYCDNERNFVHGRYKETCPDKKCIQKHREATNVQKYGNKCSLKGTNEQKVVDAIVEKYGVDNVFKLDSMQQLARQRTKEKYGKEYSSQVPELRKKVEETCMKKFGYKTNLLNPDQIEQIKRTCLEKYGNQYVCASEYTRKKTIEHNQQMYGVDEYLSTSEFKAKSKTTSLTRYGVDNPSKSKYVQHKQRETFISRYNCVWPMQIPGARERAKQTRLIRYGVEYIAQLPGYIPAQRYKKDLSGFFSKPERLFADLLDEYGITYKYNWYYNKKHWDFAIYQNGVVDTVVEIDGEWHHGYITDVRALKLDPGRYMMLPGNIKYICGASKRVYEMFCELIRILHISYDEWETEQITSIPVDFPYPTYTPDRIKHDYDNLRAEYKNHCKHRCAQYGMSTVYMYNKSIYTTRNIDKLWRDRNNIVDCVKERSLYYSKYRPLDQMLHGLVLSTVIHMPKLISTGMYLHAIYTYLTGVETIMEYITRNAALMLATNASGRNYASCSISDDVRNECNQIADIHHLPHVLDVKCNNSSTNTCLVCDLINCELDFDSIIQMYQTSSYLVFTNDYDKFKKYNHKYDAYTINYGVERTIIHMLYINCV